MKQLNDYEKYTSPSLKGPYVFFRKNNGLQNQSVLYIQKGMNGTPEVLIDPNAWGDTVALSTFVPSKDAKYAIYGISRSGSDWQEFKIMELATKKTLPDTVEWVKVSGAAWHGDGFFYSRYPTPEKGKEKASINENHQVFFHKIGTPQSADVLVFEDKDNPQRFHTVDTTEDERFAILDVSDRGKGKDGNALFVRDLSKGETTFKPLFGEIGDATYRRSRQRRRTPPRPDQPQGAELARDQGRSRQPGRSELDRRPRRKARTHSERRHGGRQAVRHLSEGRHHPARTSTASTASSNTKWRCRGRASAGGFGGTRDAQFVFYSFNSLTVPPTIFRYDIASKKSSVFRAPKVPGYDATQYETKQVFYPSKDGTKIPMFLVHKKGLVLDGNNPTLLYAYGGFNVVQSPGFSAARLALLEQGVVYASANLRGGGEYGEAWHEQGMKLKKQNVFDDFIAAAEWLIANKYTSTPQLAIQGGSNGGLLVGAVMNQRPELFGVALPAVGVMDMLRFHKFTIGWNWIADYGSSDNAEEFKALYAYSPLHNIKKGAKYPATLITTADHDDRVVPAHSFKYAATLQELASKETPILIRIETKSGHGASNLTKALETAADSYAFMLHNMKVIPKRIGS